MAAILAARVALPAMAERISAALRKGFERNAASEKMTPSDARVLNMDLQMSTVIFIRPFSASSAERIWCLCS